MKTRTTTRVPTLMTTEAVSADENRREVIPMELHELRKPPPQC